MGFNRICKLDPPSRGIFRKVAVMLCSLLTSLFLLHSLPDRCSTTVPSPVHKTSSRVMGLFDGDLPALRSLRTKRLVHKWSAMVVDEQPAQPAQVVDGASELDHEDSLILPPPDLLPQRKASPRFAGKLSPLGEGRKKFPQALIIGVKKGGTRALLEFLRVHPDIRAVGAEPHFFDRNYENGLDWYRELMPKTLEGQITMEKTPSYFVTREAPARISTMSWDTKLIVVIGIYAKHLDNWLQYFPMDQILFVSGERLISDPAGELGRVQDFLGLKRIITDKHFYFNQTKGFPCLKKAEGRTHPNIDPKVVQRLRDFYRPFNMKFYQMTGQIFGWED
ncbi:hypothetical protein LDENG_00028420 [Lucifuga dentata]|nr:hypothetical protein LDENG_00028420 [Lucifuga dentata]